MVAGGLGRDSRAAARELGQEHPNPLAAAHAQNKSPKINLARDPNGELARRLSSTFVIYHF